MYINIFNWTPYEDGKSVKRIFPRPKTEGYNGFNRIDNEVLLPYETSQYSWYNVFPENYKAEHVSEGILVFASFVWAPM